MRTCVIAATLLLMCTLPSSYAMTWDDEELGIWGPVIEADDDGVLIQSLEGNLSDPQDVDIYTLEGNPLAVHNIRLMNAEQPIHLEIIGGTGTIIDMDADVDEVILLSGDGDDIQIKVSNIVFNGSNDYEFTVYTHDGDGVVYGLPQLDSEVVTGFIHKDDSVGDNAIFEIGSNAQVELNWSAIGGVNFTAHMMEIDGGPPTPIDMMGENGTTTFQVPDTGSGGQLWNLILTMKADETAWWSASVSLRSTGDSGCSHDCSNVIIPEMFPEFNFPLTDEGIQWVENGILTDEDTVDIYPIFIEGEYWESYRIIANIVGDGVELQLQSWNNSGEFLAPFDVVNGVGTVGLNVSTGYHLVRISHLDLPSEREYTLSLEVVNITKEDDIPINPDELQDMWRKFLPFYIGIGILLLSPLFWVLWITRGTRIEDEIQSHERGRLRRLRARITALLSEASVDEKAVEDALVMLAAVQWRATEAEMGNATLTHHTGSVTLKAWRLDGSNLLIGIHIEESAWELAALRFEAVGGPQWRISEVTPSSLYDGDEIFLDTLSVGKTTFIRLTLEGKADGLNLHLSGLVDGKPLAAVPAQALLFTNEEE
ncbi:MAG: hypothetical protein QGF94_00100 [Candidatus Thalassarchaeaceae archaeon]|jgi:hypothetical protein|nr:hypothetical protein [Candidatus Thalassarchaeaceae archaeon]